MYFVEIESEQRPEIVFRTLCNEISVFEQDFAFICLNKYLVVKCIDEASTSVGRQGPDDKFSIILVENSFISKALDFCVVRFMKAIVTERETMYGWLILSKS